MTELSQKVWETLILEFTWPKKQEQKNQKKLMACGKGDDLDNLFTDSF